jgi:radical SAM superfamily enzyme YgiQ (UPF0313 family)
VKIFLVTPRNPTSFWTYDGILPTLGKDCVFPNLSMPTIAGLTDRKHELVLCDENVEPIDFDIDADIVGVTGYIIHKPRMLEIIAEFQRRGRFVVVGGPFASLCPEDLRGHCDVLFVDEAEETWPKFLRDFEAGTWKSEYRPDEKPDMSKSPKPRFDLVKVDRYHAMTIQFARGCPFNCEFCDIIVMYGRRPRAKSVDQVMAEIAECRRLGATQVFVVDDNFIGNNKLAKELLRGMARWGRENGYPIDFNTEVSLNVAADDELLSLMRAANFTTIFIGIESPRRDSLLETRKTQNTRGDLLANIRKIQSYGIQIQAGMIVGFDADDEAIFEEQLAFVQAARIPVSMTGMLQALPKTPLHARIAKEGRLLHETNGDQFAFSNILPAKMSRRKLYEGYRVRLRQLPQADPRLPAPSRQTGPRRHQHPRRRPPAPVAHFRCDGPPRRSTARVVHREAHQHGPAATSCGVQGCGLLRRHPPGLPQLHGAPDRRARRGDSWPRGRLPAARGGGRDALAHP